LLISKDLERKIDVFVRRIVKWYEEFGEKRLPWRNVDDPWFVLVAAFLLRKTTTKQVVKVYEEFTRRFPTPHALLSASEDEVRELIRPLGIEHQRSRHLMELARRIEVEFEGRVPCSEDQLRKLPGVGKYTANEVLLVGCGKPAPLLDRNMIRVIERVFGIKSLKKRPHEDDAMWAFARMLVPEDPEEARAFNYGVLDFARKICKARSPRCRDCFLTDLCKYHADSKKP